MELIPNLKQSSSSLQSQSISRWKKIDIRDWLQTLQSEEEELALRHLLKIAPANWSVRLPPVKLETTKRARPCSPRQGADVLYFLDDGSFSEAALRLVDDLGSYGAWKLRSSLTYGGVGGKIGWDDEEHGDMARGRAELVETPVCFALLFFCASSDLPLKESWISTPSGAMLIWASGARSPSKA